MSRSAALAAALMAAVWGSVVSAENWPRFRGDNGDGRSEATGLPVEWTADDYLWRASLPGLGHSSPVVWEGRVYLTSADPATGEQIALCLDAAAGDEIWQKRRPAAPHPQHATNSFATPTPAVDAEAIYLAWKSGDDVHLAALGHDGDEIWEHRVARLAERHGYGTSPVVVGDVVVLDNQTADAADSEVLGFDRRTGLELWRLPRSPGKTTYATPCLRRHDERTLVLAVSMGAGVTALDPASGEAVWNALAGDLPDRCVSSPVLAGDLVLASCGSGNNGLHLIAVRCPAGTGEPQEVYRVKKGVPNIPTPLVVGDLVFLWHDRGTVSCLDVATGEPHWTRRVGGNFHSSPVLVGDAIYGISLDGQVHVLAADRTYRSLGKTDLGESVTATPAVADGRLYIRSEQTLFCLGPKP